VRFQKGRSRRWAGGFGRSDGEKSRHDSQAPATDQQFLPPLSGRTSYARAIRGFDPQFRDALVAEITTAIGMASIVNDASVMAFRTGETIEALVQCLIATASLSPHFDTPSHLREFADGLAKRVRRGVAYARANPAPEAERMFGFRREGQA
jgi:hypothetical protein